LSDNREVDNSPIEIEKHTKEPTEYSNPAGLKVSSGISNLPNNGSFVSDGHVTNWPKNTHESLDTPR